jgi:hypothetical protein
MCRHAIVALPMNGANARQILSFPGATDMRIIRQVLPLEPPTSSDGVSKMEKIVFAAVSRKMRSVAVIPLRSVNLDNPLTSWLRQA